MIHTDPPLVEKGPARSNMVAVANGNYLSIQPPVGEEWVLLSIFYPGDCQIYWSDGTNRTQIVNTALEEAGAPGSQEKLDYTLTNSHFIQVLNNTGAAGYFGYEGYLRYF